MYSLRELWICKAIIAFLLLLLPLAYAAPYSKEEEPWNLNTNKHATDILEYSGVWSDHTFFQSPENWRMNFIAIILDRWSDGDPTNNDILGTPFENDISEVSFRNGGDIVGLERSLDYIQALGIKGIYLAGTPFENQPWGYDQFSPLDYTILDHHTGTIDQWRSAINAIHSRGMYLILDLTVATLADLVGIVGHLNDTGGVPFNLNEYNAMWKTHQHYADFNFTNVYNTSCEYPKFWGEDGSPVVLQYKGCYDSFFDQYGDTEAFGAHSDWQRQLSKFASVQDRLRDWNPNVAVRLQHLSCLVISMLDVDGFRIDKATQMTVDFIADWSMHVRECAKKYGKENFLIVGEVTGSSSYGSIYYNRGRQPDQRPANGTIAYNLTANDNKYSLRDRDHAGFDASAFHYSVYRALVRFLGMDSKVEIGYDVPSRFTDAWEQIQVNEDAVNINSGIIDARHMLGITNNDLFRWGSLLNGTEKAILGTMITTLMFPGIPLLYYGDEQGMYVLDNSADNYLYGRQAMNSARAWFIHGCYYGKAASYPRADWTPANNGCKDEWNYLDHFDVASAHHNIYMNMNSIRRHYYALSDGYRFEMIGSWTNDYYFPDSQPYATTMGLYSVLRGPMEGIQHQFYDDIVETDKNRKTIVWSLFANRNDTTTWNFSCKDKDAIIGPWKANTIVKNLIYPYDKHKLQESWNETWGCLPGVTFDPYQFKLLVPEEDFVENDPVITRLNPSHDYRMDYNGTELPIEIEFSRPMDCDSITNSLKIQSSTLPKNKTARYMDGSASCRNYSDSEINRNLLHVQSPGVFLWSAKLTDIYEGIHRVSVGPVRTSDNSSGTLARDNFLFRVGSRNNPLVFYAANYSSNLLTKQNNSLYVNHTASGATKFRYSTDFQSSWSDWMDYNGGLTKLKPANWTGTKKQAWEGEHVHVQYWSDLTASANYMQQGDYDFKYRRLFPHMFLEGDFNQYGYDSGVQNEFKQVDDSLWEVGFTSAKYPATVQFNVWGMNPDGKPDRTHVYGSQGKSSVLSRSDPASFISNNVTIKEGPNGTRLSYKIKFRDDAMFFQLYPAGEWSVSIAIYVLCIVVPPICAIFVSWMFKNSFYTVKVNKHGNGDFGKFYPLKTLVPFKKKNDSELTGSSETAGGGLARKKKCVLIATLEYDITDWQIRIKIGGLGVMAQLMAKNLKHQDLVWVVPCVGDIVYPEAEEAAPIEVKIIDQTYTINVYHHYLDNIKYVLLDAPVFRRQTTVEPYPARMDDLGSAIFYSAWNQCIAEVIRRNPIDIYHINDYHGALAPCYLLPDVIPIALSLHNAEFQGLWPLRTSEEKEEVCAVYNISQRICSRYVQFGNVFNLLHSAVSYIRIHQKGFGAVGVSNKYGKRSWARYPIFWGLKKIGKLPNPDPTDTDDVSDTPEKVVDVDPDMEKTKVEHKRLAQEWAGLEVNDKYDLLVFVGRWSSQKGVDLIADIAPPLLESYKVQLICVGPVIDLYGKFAAEKLDLLMRKYPNRVFSSPKFTQLPPYIFTGADFALIPSRDEPFGLVAVEFGRKGTLGIGAKVGGLGQMPGWWYSVESSATPHLLKQFEQACQQALSSSQRTRARLRARSAKQRFPVSQWIGKLEALTDGCIKANQKFGKNSRARSSFYSLIHESFSRSSDVLPQASDNGLAAKRAEEAEMIMMSNEDSAPTGGAKIGRSLSLGSHRGPGHTGNDDSSDGLDTIQEESMNGGDSHSGDSGNSPAGIDDENLHSPSEYSFDSADYEFDPQRSYYYDDLFDDETTIRNTPSFRPQMGNFNPEHGVGATLSQDDLIDSSHPRDSEALSPPVAPYANNSRNNPYSYGNLQTDSSLSLASVMSGKEKRDFSLTKVEEIFTDEDGKALKAFQDKLQKLTAKNSKDDLCIEQFIMKSERMFYHEKRAIKLGLQKPNKLHVNAASSQSGTDEESLSNGHASYDDIIGLTDETPSYTQLEEESEYKTIHGLQKFMLFKIYDWPVYSLFIALGQILASTAYQLTLFTGTSSIKTYQLYAICGFFIAASFFWWYVYSKVPAYYVLSCPFLFYALALFLVGLPAFDRIAGGRVWITNVGAWVYSIGSASGSIFFSLNFGEEGSVQTRVWVFRACLVQGLQQVWSAALWYWGAHLNNKVNEGDANNYRVSPAIPAITWPLSVVCIIISVILYKGLPQYYRQLSGTIPAFYKSLLRRKLVVWFCIAVFLQNFWLSTLNARSWSYFWDLGEIPQWQMFLLMIAFFIVLWALLLGVLAWIARTHSWIICVFGVGLGAPRWVQTFWATSNIGLYLPWAGRAGPYLGRTLWLWLGVLDSVQNVGIGMILLQTLTRRHVASTLMTGQIIGAVATMIGRAGAPNRLGPANVFIDFTQWSRGDGSAILASAPFWICIICQLAICVGFLAFFRRENLNRP
ncbi:alpha-1,4-glucan synthase Ags1 [Schizosaccharomyces cryophilus OY26]|uniref:alpha-1,3-glucan synthase n=1 Tax=Schizosaccharomyces cryophilus (strain OY26 / ATCC MYA-4695 / CBS 11777 / NBRC 106824 / NRRL Y48691) TaxID=653667 RepID=S9W0Y1_SCHCR|nr:alpha-1,4-glucan synthase Ags1 [Schizosaccharomyces cryophilus OY26]EPY52099.1 alpha-1,4-glucan synthase Ags1 [Schizosaccharomyces cryophilus OY26]